ncbi:hypothetical protein [Pedobacter sp.]|uniref:hypothetical protein n=1 Tax=Pedobacter sp. TaxID=1411316 RepID=UPI003D7F479F
MKKTFFYTLLAAIPLVYGCGQNTDTAKKAKDAALMDSLARQECFAAIDSNDKADLKIKTLSNGEVQGSLVIDYVEKGKNDGMVKGKFSGDTLFVDYTFKVGADNPTVYKNPLAFLKKGDSLILGVGQIETTLGRSYFVKSVPIRFDKSKFTFTTTTCP